MISVLTSDLFTGNTFRGVGGGGKVSSTGSAALVLGTGWEMFGQDSTLSSGLFSQRIWKTIGRIMNDVITLYGPELKLHVKMLNSKSSQGSNGNSFVAVTEGSILEQCNVIGSILDQSEDESVKIEWVNFVERILMCVPIILKDCEGKMNEIKLNFKEVMTKKNYRNLRKEASKTMRQMVHMIEEAKIGEGLEAKTLESH